MPRPLWGGCTITKQRAVGACRHGFLHGLSAHAAELAPVFRRLRRHSQRIIAVDLPVHGFSDAPNTGIFDETMSELFYHGMNQILEKLPPDEIFGNSLGGLGAIRYTNRHPDKVRLLVLSSPGGAGITGEQLHQLGEIFSHHTQFKPGSFVERLYNKPPLYRWMIEQKVGAGAFCPARIAGIAETIPY